MNESSQDTVAPINFSPDFKNASVDLRTEAKKKKVPVCPLDPAELEQCDSCQ